MNPMYRVKIPTPQPRYVFLSKLGGGLLWFWVLWRAKHDWNTLFTHFDADKVWQIPDPNAKSSHHH